MACDPKLTCEARPYNDSPYQFGDCRHCDARLLRVQSYLDTRSFKTVRTFKCQKLIATIEGTHDID
jgi:phage FluMu protein Com